MTARQTAFVPFHRAPPGMGAAHNRPKPSTARAPAAIFTKHLLAENGPVCYRGAHATPPPPHTPPPPLPPHPRRPPPPPFPRPPPPPPPQKTADPAPGTPAVATVVVAPPPRRPRGRPRKTAQERSDGN